MSSSESEVDLDQILGEVEDEEPTPKKKGSSSKKRGGRSSSKGSTMNVNEYDVMENHARHVLEAPNVYLDSVKRNKRKAWILKKGRFQLVDLDLPRALERLFLELVANVCDHVWTSRERGVDPGDVAVHFDLKTGVIVVESHGLPVPIDKIHPKSGKYLLETILGQLGTGSNFNRERDPNKKRHGIGANGIGAKAANLYSTRFQIVAVSPIEKLRYTQVWTGNMGETEGGKVGKPKIVAAPDAEESLFQVTYQADMPRFGYEEGEGYPKIAEALYRRHVAEVGFTAKVKTTFNGKSFNCGSIIDYAKLYFGDFGANYLTHYEWDSDVGKISRDKFGIETSVKGMRPNVEMIVVDPGKYGKGLAVGMANCIINIEGGVHIDVAYAAALEYIVLAANSSVMGIEAPRPTSKTGVGRGRGRGGRSGARGGFKSVGRGKAKAASSNVNKDGTRKKKVKAITLTDAKPLVGIIISVYVPDPDWGGGNAKLSLRGPEPTISIPEKKLAQMKKWPLYLKLQEILRGRGASIMSKLDGSKNAFLGKVKGDDATWAGTKRSAETVLIGIEGDSAMTYFTYMLPHWPHGRASLGCFPFRGKLINALKNDEAALANNKEVERLIKRLGIKAGTDYRIPENRKRLRYGKFLIMTDADVDGSHIKGLILAMFAKLWGTLLDTDFVEVYQTPVKRAYLGKKILNFYFDHEVRAWQQDNPKEAKRWELKHFKGLGGSSEEEVAIDYQNIHRYGVELGRKGLKYIHMAFGAGSSDQRKMWLAAPVADYVKPKHGKIRVTDFVNCDLKIYSLHSLVRHIPGMDGLRMAQRKAIHAAFVQWGRVGTPKEIPMTSFVSVVLKESMYTNGTAISEVIKRMSMDFVGGRNVPEFVFHSSAGTRVEGGKDAPADRYLSIRPNSWWLNLLYRPEDDPILEYTEEAGNKAEPVRYYPIIPSCNEIWCVATGYSSYIPGHHPLDLIDYFIKRLKVIEIREVKPWYRGFRGEVQVVDKRHKGRRCFTDFDSDEEIPSSEDEDASSEDEEEDDLDRAYRMAGADFDIDAEVPTNLRPRKSGRYALVTKGTADIYSKEDALVTELPVGVWMRTFKNKLIDLQERKQIKNFADDKCNAKRVWFSINGFKKFVKVKDERPASSSDEDEEEEKQRKKTKKKDAPTKIVQRSITLKDLGLVKSYGLTNLILVDDSGRPLRFESIGDIWDGFYKWRLPLYKKRKAHMLSELKKKVQEIDAKVAFITAVLKKELVILPDEDGEARDEDEVYARIEELGLDKSYYKKIISNQYSKQQVAKLLASREALMEEGRILNSIRIEDMWIRDLLELKKAYKKHYGSDRVPPEIEDDDP